MGRSARVVDEGAYALEHGRGGPIRASGETEAILGTLDRVVMAVIGGLGDRGIIGTHAGAVAIDGRAVVLAGSSGAGKSTLTLALLRAGSVSPDRRTDAHRSRRPDGVAVPSRAAREPGHRRPPARARVLARAAPPS